MLYDQSRKSAFLQTLDTDTSYDAAVRLFAASCPYEEAQQQDLADFSDDDTASLLGEIGGSKSRSKESMVTILNRYRHWCGRGKIALSDVKLELGIRREMVSSPKHLQLILDERFGPLSQYGVDCIYRAALWLALSGLKMEAALALPSTALDFETMTVHVEDKSYEMYRESLQTLRQLRDMDHFIYYHPAYQAKKTRAPGPCLLRGVTGKVMDARSLRRELREALSKDHDGMTYEKIRTSGVFYRLFELERAGVGTQMIHAVLGEEADRITREKTSSKGEGAWRSAQIRAMSRDYAAWKKAFE